MPRKTEPRGQAEIETTTEPLDARHDVRGFDSGSESLDDWLRHHALQAQRSDSTRVFVVHAAAKILGFHALSAGSVQPEHAPERLRKGQGRYDLPLVVLTRLGVDRRMQGRGLGAVLLRDALLRVEAAVDIVGARAVHAHAKDERAKSFYQHFGFEPSPLDEHSMFLLMKDLRANLGRKRRR